jgi:hypothetical protein
MEQSLDEDADRRRAECRQLVRAVESNNAEPDECGEPRVGLREFYLT